MAAKEVIPIEVIAVIPTRGGTALFLGNDDKVFHFFIDNMVGTAIAMHIGKMVPPRPLTHDLFAGLLQGIGAELERVVINDSDGVTYYARMILKIENEVRQLKLLELDARPSDAIALAVRMDAPLYVSRKVWMMVDDQSELLKQLQRERDGGGEEPEE